MPWWFKLLKLAAIALVILFSPIMGLLSAIMVAGDIWRHPRAVLDTHWRVYDREE